MNQKSSLFTVQIYTRFRHHTFSDKKIPRLCRTIKTFFPGLSWSPAFLKTLHNQTYFAESSIPRPGKLREKIQDFPGGMKTPKSNEIAYKWNIPILCHKECVEWWEVQSWNEQRSASAKCWQLTDRRTPPAPTCLRISLPACLLAPVIRGSHRRTHQGCDPESVSPTQMDHPSKQTQTRHASNQCLQWKKMPGCPNQSSCPWPYPLLSFSASLSTSFPSEVSLFRYSKDC